MDKKTRKLFMLSEFEEYAGKHLPKSSFDFFSSGADEEYSLGNNSDAFNQIKLLPKFLTNVSKIDTSVDILGKKVEFPVLIAPTSMQRFFIEPKTWNLISLQSKLPKKKKELHTGKEKSQARRQQKRQAPL